MAKKKGLPRVAIPKPQKGAWQKTISHNLKKLNLPRTRKTK